MAEAVLFDHAAVQSLRLHPECDADVRHRAALERRHMLPENVLPAVAQELRVHQRSRDEPCRAHPENNRNAQQDSADPEDTPPLALGRRRLRFRRVIHPLCLCMIARATASVRKIIRACRAKWRENRSVAPTSRDSCRSRSRTAQTGCARRPRGGRIRRHAATDWPRQQRIARSRFRKNIFPAA